jgi:TolB-like protein
VLIADASVKNGLPVSDCQPAHNIDLVQSHLERVIASAEMRRSKSLCQFLRFTVEEVLRGHGNELKEYEIGAVAFRRGRQFDTGNDPIVRVQARRLRSKLERYYAVEGRDEPIRIDYPVGSYSPVFVERSSGRPQTRLLEPANPGGASRMIAVIPFTPVGAEDSEAFSDGLTDELIHALSGSDGLQVIARSSSFQFKGRSEDVRRIGESLGVTALVSGTVRMEGPRVRVLAQLIDAGTGVNLWSAAYDRELSGVLLTQQEISIAVAGIVKTQLGVRVQAA